MDSQWTSLENSSTIYLNGTEFEDDPFGEVDEEQMQVHSAINSVWSYMIYYIIVMGLIKFILCLVVLAADLFLIITIFRFKRLRTRTNMYILNYCILNVIYYLTLPLMYLIFDVILPSASVSTFCLALQTQATLSMLSFTFIICLSLDWLVSAYKPTVMKTYHKYYKFVFVAMYVLFALEWIFAAISCETRTHPIGRYLIGTVFYVIYLVFLTILNGLLRWKLHPKADSAKTAYAVTAANIVIFSFVPMFVFHAILTLLTGYHGVIHTIFMYSEFIPDFIVVMHPVILVYKLGQRSKHFKMAYDQSFKRSVKRYGTDNLDEASEDEGGFRNNRVQVSNLHDDGFDEGKHVLII